ncbi:MAG: tryptophan synthase subunit alpha [Candidatus Omnitrophota bacterium]|nr:tryptophan synthase subunit alpha [Candidatus Omnitrophota bacterium]
MTIKDKFNQLREEGRKAFIAYVPFGFPSIKRTKDILLTLQEAGVDIIELGIPFSDPIADGPIIQEATTIALNKGANIQNLFVTLKELKKDLKIPVALMTYYNPVFRFGIRKFFAKMHSLDISGIIVVDLSLEESATYIKEAKNFLIETIFFITPVTPIERAKKIIKASNGFIYYISVTGTTGIRDISYASLATHIRKLKTMTKLPICVGFGIHTRKQVKKVYQFSDGAIVGSAIVKFIRDNHSKRGFLERLRKYVKSLRSA